MSIVWISARTCCASARFAVTLEGSAAAAATTASAAASTAMRNRPERIPKTSLPGEAGDLSGALLRRVWDEPFVREESLRFLERQVARWNRSVGGGEVIVGKALPFALDELPHLIE